MRAGFTVENEAYTTPIEENKIEKQEEKVIQKTKEGQETKDEQEKWCLEIPKINLKANIEEGTSKEIMDRAIGHFEETSKEFGNIGLAAHNRGYKNNYFERIKELEEGDTILYQYQERIKEYVVVNHCIIKDTDWSYLENTKENTITLITCVENEPEYRRCLQGIEK